MYIAEKYQSPCMDDTDNSLTPAGFLTGTKGGAFSAGEVLRGTARGSGK